MAPYGYGFKNEKISNADCGYVSCTDGVQCAPSGMTKKQVSKRKFDTGDKVKIVDIGNCYSTYEEKAREMDARYWKHRDADGFKGKEGIIMNCAKHGFGNDIYLVRMLNKDVEFIFGEKGLKLITKSEYLGQFENCTTATKTTGKMQEITDRMMNEMIENFKLKVMPEFKIGVDTGKEEDYPLWSCYYGTPIFKDSHIKNNNKPMETLETLKNGVLKLTKEIKNRLERMMPEYRDLYRAGYINGDLIETSKYDRKMMEILRAEYRDEVTKAAREEIKEAEDEEKKKNKK